MILVHKMNQMNFLRTIFLLSLTLFSFLASAQLPPNIPICTAEGMQRLPQATGAGSIVSDGEGGVVVVFEDLRTNSWDIYVQRVDAVGEVLWQTNGISVCRKPGYQGSAQIVRTGKQFVIAWWDLPDVKRHIYAQALNLSGEILWKAEGVPVCTHPKGASAPTMLSDGKGGVLCIWGSNRDGSQNLYLQRLNADGQPMFDIDGIPIFPTKKLRNYLSKPSSFQVVKGDANDFYVVWWEESRINEYHIMVHRLNINGKHLWKSPIVALPEKMSQGRAIVTSDGDGGIIIAWHPFSNYTADDLYAQRINPKGKKPWGKRGVAICKADGIQKDATVVSDGNGGVVAVWVDERDIYADIYAQRISAKGKAMWQADGIPICTAGSLQTFPRIVRKRKDEFLIAWVDYRDDLGFESKNAIYGQRINLNGQSLWDTDGKPFFTSAGYHLQFFNMHFSESQLTVVWNDAKIDLGDIYLRQMNLKD